ncbi:hypothetical protein TcasGA2_TC002404 [Tribolium castaneum]|uniref:Uncharacterized protein n=1 Tax=Tribolium castaneum TaxID=7070 RepID=D6WIU0_TRICA|nr:hypothetical protein TcasGA2_TC002404 [Tribolium castaneum]
MSISQVENVSTRVKNTKKEIEQLKTELEKLISLGTQPPEPPTHKPAPDTQTVKKKAPPDPEKKPRSYDVTEARNYIKKQREKRAEQLRAQINTTDNKLDLKKQKLKELHQKTLELVTKNVQLKRERSKSRDKGEPPVRIDRSKAREKGGPLVRTNRPKSQDKGGPPKIDRSKSPAQKVSEGSEKTQKSERISRAKAREPQKLAKTSSEAKETQTCDKGAPWLEPPCAAYPYNFINTVKRKLQFAVNSPRNFIDIGVQNSGTPPLETKSREEIKELLIKSAKSELRSFVSHKCLDLKPVENLELREVSKNLFNNCDSGSESDTSKNIPDISSESLKLDFDKLKNYKLQKSDDSYSSDFHKESVSFKSLLTEKKVSKNFSDSDSVPESLTMKQPNVSLSVRNLSLANGKMNTVTIKSASEKNYLSDSNFSQEKQSFKSLLVGGKNSESVSDHLETSKIITTEENTNNLETSSKNSSSKIITEENTSNNRSLSLEKPQNDGKNQLKNITLRPSSSTNNVNEIHLKFEAEVRLLNDFNESFKQFMAVEKAFENIKNKNETNIAVRKILQNVDTQTSFIAKTSTEKSPRSSVNTINFSRGSEIIEELNDSIMNASKSLKNSSFSTTTTEWNLSNLNESSVLSIAEEEQSKFSISNIENYNANNCASLLSLNIFDQLIKDEDTRIQQLKAIIKIREQALLDRTKGELVWLEIQKKQLIETGKIEEASLLKKKQRGILLKHEQERNEIKKLKQMQKEASEKRKNTLKRQRNLIKTRLSTDDMLSQITVKKRKERRTMGPLRVVQSRSETKTELLKIAVFVCFSSESLNFSAESYVEVPVANAKRTLLMREAALQKRRKAAEELLRWHRKLLDEEKKIAELEAAATSVIKRPQKKWKSFDEKIHACKSARQYSNKHKKPVETETSGEKSAKNYSSAFEIESVHEEKTKISSIAELIDNFAKIGDEISTLSKKSSQTMTPNYAAEEKDFEEIEDLATTPEESIDESSKTKVEELPVTEENIEDCTPQTEEIEDNNDSRVALAEESHVPTEEIEESSNTSPVTEGKSEVVTTEEIEDINASSTKDLAEESQVVTTEEIEESLKKEEKLQAVTTESQSSKENSGIVTEASINLLTEEIEETTQSVEKPTEEIEETTQSEQKPTEETPNVSQSSIKEETGASQSSNVVVTEESGESSKTKSEEIETPKSSSKKTGEVIEDISSDSQSLSLEEALESASKIEESLSRLNKKLANDQNEETTPQKKNQSQIDVKKRVSEILADVSLTRGDKSPRLQDIYVTAYDVGASNSQELSESLDGRQLPTDIFGSEAEELWRKQLAIEQEIKQLELQQKEQLPYVFMREIPNKPPPPYTPPSSLSSSFPHSIIPTEAKEISEIASYSSKVLHKAHQNNTLEKVKFSENGFKLFSKIEVSKICAEFLFNICKDVARDHYKQFEIVKEPSWLTLAKKPQLAKTKPPDSLTLEKILTKKLKELFGFKKVQVAESAIIKWGRKKRDHVDEVLVLESQEEESQWTNFDKDELIVKNQVTVDIMKMLLEETADVFAKILAKK